MVGYVFELPGQLAVDGFDDLAGRDEEAANRLRALPLLVAPGQGEQTNAIVLPEFGRHIRSVVRLIADDVSVCMLGQEVDLVAEDRLFSGGDLAKICAMGWPITSRSGRQVEQNLRNWQAVEISDGSSIHKMLVLRESHLGQHHASHLVDDQHQLPLPSVEATLLWQDGKPIPTCLHMTEQLRFQVPASAFADQTDGYQFTISILRLRPRSSQLPCQRLAHVVNEHMYP